MKKRPIDVIAVGLRGCLRMELTNADFIQVAMENELPIIHVLGTRRRGAVYIAPSSGIVFFTHASEPLFDLNVDYIVTRNKFSMHVCPYIPKL